MRFYKPLIQLCALSAVLLIQLGTTPVVAASVVSPMSKSALPFEKNIGQYEGLVQYVVRTFAGTVGIVDGTLQYAFSDGEGGNSLVREQFFAEGAARSFSVEGREAAPTVVNHLLGSDPHQWYHNIPTYRTLQGSTPYPGIELTLEATQDSIEKIFTVLPGAQPQDIVLGFDTGTLRLDENGDMILVLPQNEITFRAPYAWQWTDTHEQEVVPVQYVLHSQHQYGFLLPEGYDPERTLYIDPIIKASYVGGSGDDIPYDMAEDSAGNIIVTGSSTSANFPVTNGSTPQGGTDVFVQKWDSTLTTLLASTYIGGSGSDYATQVRVDSADNIFIAGGTQSTNYPSTVGATPAGGTWRHMVTKLPNSLGTVTASRVFNTSNTYAGAVGGMEINDNDEILITAHANNTGELAGTVLYGANTDYDVYVANLSNTLGTINSVLRTGSGTDNRMHHDGIELDSNGNLVMVFPINGDTYPTTEGPSAPLPGISGFDLVVARFAGDFSALQEARYYGSASSNWVRNFQLDPDDNIYFDIRYGANSGDPYDVIKLNPSMDFLWSRNITSYFNSSTTGFILNIDGAGVPYYSGGRSSSGAPARTDGSTFSGNADAAILSLDPNTGIVDNYGVFGGSLNEFVETFFSSTNQLYFFGYSDSTNFPVTDGSTYQGGGTDILLGQFSFSTTEVSVEQAPGAYDPTTVAPKFRITFASPILPSSFEASDITVSDGEVVALQEVAPFDHTTYEFFVIGMNPGVITASLASGVAQDSGGVGTLPSTSVDNQITYALATQHSQGEILSIQAQVTEALIMTLDAVGVTLTADPAVNDGQYLAGKSIITIASNALSGYSIQAELDDGDGNAQLVNAAGDPILSDLSEGDNYLGYTARNDGTGSATTAEQVFSENSTTLLDNNNAPVGFSATTDSQQHTINYDLNVNFLTPAGVYAGTIYYTVVAGF